MSIATLLLTDTAKSGVPLDYFRPPASEKQNQLATGASGGGQSPGTHRNPSLLPPKSPQSAFTVSNARSISPGRIGSASSPSVASRAPRPSSGGPTTQFEAGTNVVEEAHAIVIFDSPLSQFTEQRPRPDFISDDLAQSVAEAAQEYGHLLDLATTNGVPDLSKLRTAAYHYYNSLKVVQKLFEDEATDLDCIEEIDQLVAETMAECLYNIGLSHLFSASQRVGDIDGNAITEYTQAAAVFDFLMNSELTQETEKLELSDDTLRALSALSLATAYEVSLQYYYSDTFHQVDENAALAHKSSYYYTLAAAVVNNSFVVANREMLLNFCNIKRLFMEGVMMFIKSLELGTTKGDSRRRKALEAFEEAQQHLLRVLPGDRMPSEMEITWYTKRCNKFKKIMKKGHLIEGSFTNKKRRSDFFKAFVPAGDITPQYPTELADIIAADRRRAEEEESGLVSAGLTNSDPADTFGTIKPLSGTILVGADDNRSEAGSEAEDFSHVKLGVDVFVDNEDIRLLPPPIAPSATHYHLITTMVTLAAPSLNPAEGRKKKIGDDEFALSVSTMSHRSSAATNITTRSLVAPSARGSIADQAQDKTQQLACSHCAAIFFVDLNMQDGKVRSAARSAVSLAIRCGRFTEQDRIGLLTFDKFGEGSIKIVPASVDHVNAATKELSERKVASKFEGARGPFLVKAINSAVDLLTNLEATEHENNVYGNKSTADAAKSWVGNKSIFIIGDGAGNAIASDYDNWQLYNTAETRRKLSASGVQIHCFSAGDAADHQLFSAMSKLTKGNHGAIPKFDVEQAPMKLTRWVVSVVSSMKQRVASSIAVDLKCAQGILIASIVSEYYTAPPTTQYNLLKSEATIPVLPISAENETHVLVTFAVPATHCKRDVIDLAGGSVTYFDSIRSNWEKHPITIRNICSNRTLSREIHYWATQMQAVDCRGNVIRMTPSASRNLIRGGEIAGRSDVFSTLSEKASATLISIEGTRIEIKGSTTVMLGDIAVNNIGLTLNRGSVNITTSNECKLTLSVDSVYSIEISPSSCVSVTLDHRAGEMNANCVVGTAIIKCLEGKVDPVLLPSPRQTTAMLPEAPLIPWVVNEKTFYQWIAQSNVTTIRLKNRIRIETHVTRTKTAAILAKVGRYMERSLRVGTLPHNFATIVCRQIAMFVLLSKAKADISSSIAYSTSNKTLDKIRRVVDEYAQLTQSRTREKRTWLDVYFAQDNAVAIATERGYGGGQVFSTSDANQQTKIQQSEKSRFAMLLKEQKDREAEAGRNQERERREELLQPSYIYVDFGAVNRAEIRHILTVWYDMPHLWDAAPAVEDTLLTAGCKLALSEEQFYTVLNHATESLGPNSFDAFATILKKKIHSVAKAIEATRVNRSLFAIFTAFDFGHRGYLTVPDLVSLFQQVFGDNLQQFKRIEAFTKAVLADRNGCIDEAEEDLALLLLGQPQPGATSNSSASTPTRSMGSRKPAEASPMPAAEPTATPAPESADAQTGAPTPVSESIAMNGDGDEPSQDATPAPVTALTELIPKPKGAHWDKPSPTALQDIKVTITTFLVSMEAFFEGVAEQAVHAQINQLRNHIAAKAKVPQTTQAILVQKKLEEEKQHLVSWDLRHIFDGISPKDVRKIISDDYKPTDEALYQIICAPLCVLAGIEAPVIRRPTMADSKMAIAVANAAEKAGGGPQSPSRNASAGLSSHSMDYWTPIHKRIKEDFAGFTKYLQSYPPLSISHRQAIKVSAHLKDPRIAPEAVLPHTPIISQLLSWVRLMLRIAYLSNNYESAPPLAERLVSEAVAIQKHVEGLTAVTYVQEHKRAVAHDTAAKQAPQFSLPYTSVFDTPDIHDSRVFGTVTKFQAEPPSGRPALGKPQLIRSPHSPHTGTGTQSIVARMAEDAAKSHKKVDEDLIVAKPEDRPISAPTNGITAQKSQLSFRSMEPGQQQRLHRVKSQTTTGNDASYLKTRGSQIHFGPSNTASSNALRAGNAYATAGLKVPTPPPRQPKNENEASMIETTSVADSAERNTEVNTSVLPQEEEL